MATGHWGKIEAELAVDFDFKCAYCDKDLLASVDNYKEWQREHIVPSSEGGAEHMSNFALSCRTCNFIKGVWNPLTQFQNVTPTKAELIFTARKYIEQKRFETQEDINLYLELIEQYS
ncbi:HNH endonuclease [Endozoicomonas euniceicola]|uniref:HNH endonuclease n=1 Tax=Endozoicomonas euniceicola TaxID=1234143 RepID=A0ABY6GU34_9GAMM|nr:HNH endonuclease signature motif containing protein [Endozoicomonas euniceicola]UYM16297.1 HNH endonuclease [Endozoicomonas euniceicola]